MRAGCGGEASGSFSSFLFSSGLLSLSGNRRQFFTVGDQRATFFEIGTIESKNLVVGAGDEFVRGIIVRFIVPPNANALEANQGRFAVLGQPDIDVAAVTVDVA